MVDTVVSRSQATVVPINTTTSQLAPIAQPLPRFHGTVTLNGATPVTVANAFVTANSSITFTLKTVGGTVSPSAPNCQTITPGTGFTVAGTALDVSVYNYRIEG
jgi:hypothetical protein